MLFSSSWIFRSSAVACLIGICLIMASCEDQRADRAYLRGDYDSSVANLRDLANAGEARAQYNLGLMYASGQGVRQDYVTAYFGSALRQVGGTEMHWMPGMCFQRI
ncbi:MAG: hypothetical protein ACT4OO_13895 [Nitrospiraceae bacterium]